jgi:prepilin-type N-terminal cleavage/methylation domain-containing protein
MKMNLSPNRRRAFTLVELLVVMAVIATLAAMLFPAAAIIKKNAAIRRTTSELERVATAIDTYKADRNHYPPDNPDDPALNPLFYELSGTTNVLPGVFVTESGYAVTNANFFGPKVAGFVNVSRGSGDEAQRARNHLVGLKPDQYLEIEYNPGQKRGVVLGLRVKGPYMLLSPTNDVAINPWRYDSSSPTNNPGTYDLWIDVTLGGKTLRINNWSKKPENVP